MSFGFRFDSSGLIPGIKLLPLSLLLLLGCRGPSESTRKEPTVTLADTSYGWVAVDPLLADGSKKVVLGPNLVDSFAEITDALPMLQEARVSMVLTLQALKLRDPAQMEELFRLVEAARKRGLEVRPMPVLSFDDGFFPNAANVELYVPVVHDLIAQWKARGLASGTLVVDMEPPRELTEALANTRLAKAIPRKQIDRERYARAKLSFAKLVDELHEAGWNVSVTTQPLLLADYEDGDDDLRQYLNVVLDDVAWDQLEFQLYRSAFSKATLQLDSYFVYDFARRAQKLFPGKTIGIGVGLTHPGPIFPDTKTEDSRALRSDLEAALAAGVPRERITVYSLKGILLGPPVCEKTLSCAPDEYVYKANDPRSWFINAAGAPPPKESASADRLFNTFKLLDRLLNMSEGSQSD